MNFILGKNSFIGKQFFKKFSDCILMSSHEFSDKNTIHFDLNNPEKFNYCIFNKNTKIIFLAAISSPDTCNNYYEEVYKINVLGTKYFIKESLKKGAKILFFSSDVIYGNTKEKVDENSFTNPFGNYAKMKDDVEKSFENEKNFKIFRLSYVLSKEDKYLSYLKSCVNNNEIAEVFHPFSRKVVYIEDVLESIRNILVKWDDFENQKFNICGGEDISRKDIADFYSKAIEDKLKYKIIQPDNKFWEARPKDINITSIYFEILLGRKPIKIKNAINQIVKEK